MNFIEAVKSGKRFRRKGWDPDHQEWNRHVADIVVDNTDVIADDWEIEPMEITLSEEQFHEAYDKAYELFKSREDLRSQRDALHYVLFSHLYEVSK